MAPMMAPTILRQAFACCCRAMGEQRAARLEQAMLVEDGKKVLLCKLQRRTTISLGAQWMVLKERLDDNARWVCEVER
jgi:hypothetical protein